MREQLVFRRQGRRRHLGDHEAGIEAAFGHQERRQAAEMGVHQQGDPALRQGAGFGQYQRQHVRGHGHRLGVEVAAGQDVAAFGKDQRVVGDGVGLPLQHAGRESQMVEAGAHHLGLAAERVGVLDPFVAGQVRLADGAARRAGGAAAAPHRSGRAARATHGYGGRTARRCPWRHRPTGDPATRAAARQSSAANNPSKRQSGRDLGAVQQGQTFLGLQHQRLKPRRRQPFRRRNGLAADRDFADADQGRRQVGQRRQIARSADGALGRDHRQDAMIGESQQQLDHDQGERRSGRAPDWRP